MYFDDTDGLNNVRLAGGSNPDEGRVEIFFNDEWGTICDDSFGIDEGHVICRQLGYDGATDYLHTSVFGEGYGPILGFLDCTGDENYFMDCIYQDWGTTACSHREDVGLICSDDDGEFNLLQPCFNILHHNWNKNSIVLLLSKVFWGLQRARC